MESRVELPMKDEAIFSDISKTIKTALENTYKKNTNKKQISETAFGIALKQLI